MRRLKSTIAVCGMWTWYGRIDASGAEAVAEAPMTGPSRVGVGAVVVGADVIVTAPPGAGEIAPEQAMLAIAIMRNGREMRSLPSMALSSMGVRNGRGGCCATIERAASAPPCAPKASRSICATCPTAWPPMSALGRKQTPDISAFLIGFRLLRSPDGGALHWPRG